MKKIGVAIAGVIGGLALLVGVVGLLMPGTWQVRTSKTIQASPEQLYTTIVDLHTWPQWTAWNKELDPSAEWRFSGTANTVGHAMAWTGEEMGDGRLVLTSVAPHQEVRYELTFGTEDVSQGGFLLSPATGGTEVVWWIEGELGINPIARLMGPMIQSYVTADFEVGLTHLQGRAEAAAKKSAKIEGAPASVVGSSD